jgi:tRNA-2-methylthio-N6-dimethylallyladenosine synthase
MNNPAQKKLFIKTWGCQMNVYDSNRMADVLAPLGYKAVDTPEDADMVILNTCHIREKATDKVFSELGRLKELQEYRKRKMAGGCSWLLPDASRRRKVNSSLERAPYVDMVFGPQTYHELPEMVAKATGAYGKEQHY